MPPGRVTGIEVEMRYVLTVPSLGCCEELPNWERVLETVRRLGRCRGVSVRDFEGKRLLYISPSHARNRPAAPFAVAVPFSTCAQQGQGRCTPN